MKHSTTVTNYQALISTTIRKRYWYFLTGVTIIVIGFALFLTFFAKKNLLTISYDLIGIKLKTEKLQPKQTKTQTLKINQPRLNRGQYTIKPGDYLWKIALEIYGDGYAWVKIAQENKMENPNIIHEGNILTIP